MSMWDQLNSSGIGSGNYIQPGGYVVEIVSCSSREASQNQRSGVPSFAVEFKVVWSHPKNSATASRPGEVVKWVQMIGGNVPLPTAYGAINEFFAAVLQNPQLVDPKTGQPIDRAKLADAACSTANPLRGYKVLLEASLKATQKGGDFTLHKWRMATAELLQQIGLA